MRIVTLIYVILMHFAAGMILGSLFTVETLVVLLFFEVISSIIFALACFAWLGDAIALQMGYVAGVFGRGLLEETGIWAVGVHPRRIL